MSRRRTSGLSAWAIRTALSPSLAVPMRSTPEHLASSSCSRSAASGSSSAINILSSGSSPIGPVQRQRHDHPIATTVDGSEVALRRVAEAGPQALADVAEAEAGAFGRILALARQSVLAAVADFHLDPAGTGLLRRNAQDDFVAGRRDSVLDRILDHGLQDQGREP